MVALFCTQNTPDQLLTCSNAKRLFDMNDLSIQIIRNDTEFENIEKSWNELTDDAEYPNIFTSWDWQFIWWKHFGKKHGNELLILLIYSDDLLIGIVPLYRQKRSFAWFRGRRHIQLIGYGGRTCPEYLGPIVRKGFIDKVVDSVVDFFGQNPKEWDSIFFEDYALDDPATTTLVERLKREFVPYGEKGEIRYTLPLPKDYETYLKSLGPHNRKGKRSRMNQAKKHHNAYATYPEIEEIEQWFPVITSLTTESRTRQGQDSPLQDEVYAAFHRELLRRLLPQKRILVQILFFDDEPVSSWYVYLLKEKCYAYQQGSKTNAKGSPGDVGTLFLIDKLMQEGITEFDFLRGLEWYKTSYTEQFRETAWLYVFRKRGLAWRNRLFVDQWIKPVYRRIRSIIRRNSNQDSGTKQSAEKANTSQDD